MPVPALTALDVHSDATTVITGSEDFTAQICNIQSSRVVGSLTGELRIERAGLRLGHDATPVEIVVARQEVHIQGVASC